MRSMWREGININAANAGRQGWDVGYLHDVPIEEIYLALEAITDEVIQRTRAQILPDEMIDADQ